jgi:DNA-binding response OmpR family regulator
MLDDEPAGAADYFHAGIDNFDRAPYVNRLRRKLEAIDPSFTGIETVVGAGYRWR